MAVARLHDPGRRILVVDDEESVRAIVARALQPHGYHVDGAADLQAARRVLDAGRVDAVILDIGLGGASGIDLLRELRAGGGDVPVLMLSGRGAEGDRVLGFELGADDYLVKPFYARELAARVGALLRRRAGTVADELRVGRLRVDRAAREAFVDGEAVPLTSRELDLLAALMAAGRHVRTREQLLHDVWDSSTAWQTAATVTEHVRRLRLKLQAAGLDGEVVATVRGLGYRFDASHAE